MGLTQISTDGVKNDAISAGKIPANAVGNSELSSNSVARANIQDGEVINSKLDGNAVTTSKINDGAVTLAKLAHGNSSNNGKFLRSNDGADPTWEDANQYTHPNHSGEVTSSADGAQTIASNVVDEDNLKISNSGTNGQFLQKQSGNTGGLTWADVTIPPGGNTVDMVADGAIGAGKPVIITSGGKAKEVTLVLGPRTSPPGQRSSAEQVFSGSMYAYGLLWDPDRETVIFQERNSSNYGQLVPVDYNLNMGTDSVTVNSFSTYSTNSGTANQDLAYDPDTNQVITCYRRGTNGHIRLATINADKSITWGAESSAFGSQVEWMRVEYNTDQNVIVVVYVASNALYARSASISGSSVGSWGTAVQLESLTVPSDHVDACYDSTNHKVLVAFRNASYGNYNYVVALSSSGTTVSWGTKQLGENGISTSHQRICFDSTLGKAIVTMKNDGNSRGYAQVFYISSGTTIAKGSGAEWPQSHGTYLHLKGHANVYDPATGKIFVMGSYTNYSTSSDRPFITQLSINNSTNAVVWEPSSGGNTAKIFKTQKMNDSARDWAAVALGTSGKILCACRNIESYANQAQLFLFEAAISQTNINTIGNNVLGFAPSAISDGNSGTINLPGNTVDNQSSLTAGSRYYIQNDGTLGTTFITTRAGVLALSATKGVVYGHDT